MDAFPVSLIFFYHDLTPTEAASVGWCPDILFPGRSHRKIWDSEKHIPHDGREYPHI